MAEDSICRWGLMSTATIGRKNWQAIKLSGNGKVTAVASRSAASSQSYIDECQANVPFAEAPRAIEGYENLLAADDVDAVYIPLPTGIRKEWVIRAANAGKHVLCEKPCACNADDLAEMIAACKSNNVQFMDGVMYMHGKRLGEIKKALGEIGELKRITTQFSFCGDEEFSKSNIRTNSELEPLGCMGDLGWYTIRFALWVMDYQMPQQVIGRFLKQHQRDDSPDAVPIEMEGELHFAGGVTSAFYNSFVTGNQQWAHVSGTDGNVFLHDFVLPYAGPRSSFVKQKPSFAIDGCDFEMSENGESVVVDEPANSAVNSQETHLFRDFGSIVLSGNLDDHWPTIALKTQRLMDACVASAKNESRPVEIV